MRILHFRSHCVGIRFSRWRGTDPIRSDPIRSTPLSFSSSWDSQADSGIERFRLRENTNILHTHYIYMKSSAREIPPSAAAAAAAPPVAPAPAASSSSSSPIPSLHESFLIVLNDSIGRRALFQFLESTYTEHHLAFWEAVQFEYKPIQTDSDRNTAAVQLWNRYVKTGTSQQINITEPQRLRLQTSIEKIGTIGKRNMNNEFTTQFFFSSHSADEQIFSVFCYSPLLSPQLFSSTFSFHRWSPLFCLVWPLWWCRFDLFGIIERELFFRISTIETVSNISNREEKPWGWREKETAQAFKIIINVYHTLEGSSVIEKLEPPAICSRF